MNRIHLILFLQLILTTVSGSFAQEADKTHRILFISDCQAPMPAEKIILKSYRNEEARDSLFADIVRQQPGNLFLTGDIVSAGSDPEAWLPVEKLMKSLHRMNSKVYAIPGNHEYMMRRQNGIQSFISHFSKKWLTGYCANADSVAVVMLNSNFQALSSQELSTQLKWYHSTLDSLDADPATKAIIVCTHHAPYSNSRIVGSSEPVSNLIVPLFVQSDKSTLFISGHSHNLEYFAHSTGKHFLVIGGGGGITQPLVPEEKRIHHDLLKQDLKPLYFYLEVERNGNYLDIRARGFKKDFRFFTLEIGRISLD